MVVEIKKIFEGKYMMKDKFFGLNPLSVSGSKFELGYGFSKFISFKLNDKSYTPIVSAIVNTWGIKNQEDKIKEKVFGKIQEGKDNLHFSVDCANVEILDNFIAGYPSIRLGESIWGPSTGFKLGQVKDYKKMNISTKWKFSVDGFANFAYDIWLTKNREGPIGSEDIELMIWLDYNFDLPHKKLDETKDFIVKYHEKEAGGKHWLTFLLKNKNGAARFDLTEIFKICKKKVKNIDSYYIRSIDLGTEFSKNTQADVKLQKLDFDFIKKN
jgi:hypothetical protein